MILVNGQVQDSIPVSDRGLMYGDGVFRTLVVHSSIPSYWLRHYHKLSSDCQKLDIQPPSFEELGSEILRIVQNEPDCILKVIVTRGSSGRGYAADKNQAPRRIVLTAPLPVYPDDCLHAGVRVHLCNLQLAHQPRLAGVKHLNRLENILARMEWNDEQIAEGLMCDTFGNVIEGTMSNLFAVMGSTLITPDLSYCGVAGVQRDRIMEYAGKTGLQPKVAHLPLERLLAADELWLCNSLIGVWQIRELKEKTWPTGKWVSQIRQVLKQNED